MHGLRHQMSIARVLSAGLCVGLCAVTGAAAQDADPVAPQVPVQASEPVTGAGQAPQAGEALAGDEQSPLNLDLDLAAPVAPASLANMRADLLALGKALQSLRAELVASGPAGFARVGGTDAIARMNAMEADIARLTGQLEQLRNRVQAAVSDGTNRAGDMEFRLCELDPACDLGALTTTQLGASAGQSMVPGLAQGTDPFDPAVPGAVTMDPAMAAAEAAAAPDERADFAVAAAALSGGDYARAAALFASFSARHSRSPLVAEALYLQGEALAASGDGTGAAEAWLGAFAAEPGGARAPQAILALAGALQAAGKTVEACLFMTDLQARFAGTAAADEAATRMAATDCAPPTTLPDASAYQIDPEEAADLADGG